MKMLASNRVGISHAPALHFEIVKGMHFFALSTTTAKSGVSRAHHESNLKDRDLQNMTLLYTAQRPAFNVQSSYAHTIWLVGTR